jgi:hypothetical protein
MARRTSDSDGFQMLLRAAATRSLADEELDDEDDNDTDRNRHVIEAIE